MEVVVWDCETLNPIQESSDFEKSWALGFGSAVVYSYTDDLYSFFAPHQAEMCELALKGKCVVSFNGTRFDNGVVLGTEGAKPDWKDVDLFQIVAYRKFGMSIEDAVKQLGTTNVFNGSLSLGALCKATLGKTKSGKGVLAPRLIAEKNWSSLFAYNLQDVRLTRQLFEFIGENRYCFDGHGNRIEIPDFKL